MLEYFFMLITATMLFYLKFSGYIYFVVSLILNIIFIYLTILLYKDEQNKIAGKVFAFSILYLFLLFLGAIIDKAWRI